MTKFAAAAVIIIAVVVGINPFLETDTSVAFAEVVKPFLVAKSATFKTQMKFKGNDLSLDTMYKEPLHMRFKISIKNFSTQLIV